MELEYIDELDKTLKPLGVNVTSYMRDNTYYIKFDSVTGQLNTFEAWSRLFGLSFEQIALRNLMQYQTPKEVHRISDLEIEFEMGTLFDFLSKNTNE